MVAATPPSLPPRGVSAALLTPVAPDGTLDLPALDRAIARVLAADVAGLAPAGSTGEGPRLSVSQRRELIRRVVRAAEGRPVIAGVPCATLQDATAELRQIAEVGADAALVAPPGYYGHTDSELAGFFTRLADLSPLPLVLYHIPRMARAGFSPGLVGELAAHERIVGLKDSSRDLEYLRRVVRRTADEAFHVVTGTDALLLESLGAGAVGAIAPSCCVAPSWAVEVMGSWSAGRIASARQRQDALAELVTACRDAGFPAGWKAAAALTGVCRPHPVPPGRPLDRDAHTTLRRQLTRLALTDDGHGAVGVTAENTETGELDDGP